MTNWQERVAIFARHHDLLHDPATHALDLVSEVGEVAKEVLPATDYGQRSPHFRAELAGELGDALYSLLVLAKACGVDANDALSATLQKYERRLTDHGSTGSA
jgi:NTP pyrophosphatase (non-canonical NTP hydrolase)